MNDIVRTDYAAEEIEACKHAITAVFNGELLQNYLKDVGLSGEKFYAVLDSTPELSTAYARAKRARAEMLANEIVHIADTEPDANRARNRMQARQWYAGKIMPKEYGDRLDVNVTQTVDIGQALADARARALRPMSDQLEMDDAQVVEFKEITEPSAHDKQSDAQPAGVPQAPEEKPDGG
jgi:hypothetical protein